MSHSPKDHARAWEDLNNAPVSLLACCKVEAEQRCCRAATFLAAALATAARSLPQPTRQHTRVSPSSPRRCVCGCQAAAVLASVLATAGCSPRLSCCYVHVAKSAVIAPPFVNATRSPPTLATRSHRALATRRRDATRRRCCAAMLAALLKCFRLVKKITHKSPKPKGDSATRGSLADSHATSVRERRPIHAPTGNKQLRVSANEL